MTEKVLERMLLIVMWQDREAFCKNYGDGCIGCPFDQSRVCDRATTVWVLEQAAKTFQKYFDEIKERTGNK